MILLTNLFAPAQASNYNPCLIKGDIIIQNGLITECILDVEACRPIIRDLIVRKIVIFPIISQNTLMEIILNSIVRKITIRRIEKIKFPRYFHQ